MVCFIVTLCCSVAFVAFVFLAALLCSVEDCFYDVRTTFKWFYGKYQKEKYRRSTHSYTLSYVYACELCMHARGYYTLVLSFGYM